MNQLKSICVYCGSSSGRSKAYASSARVLAQSLVNRNITLVYGGASIGIMGLLADQMLELGGKVIGIIPKALAHKEVMHKNLTELHITESMHERKMLMAELSDGFIALPGGIGTLEEMFEIWTWAQLGIHNKPCGLLNIDGYYDTLIQFLDHMLVEQFVKQRQHDLLIIESQPEKLLEHYVNYQAVATTPWLNKDET
ncbi:LOG family protein [Methyloprofundus sedimenti]|uniref:Cytokinin riboside 5'-monophosphate phosphoribohydrolase n=1 Tax=Methyloprofundus sedimenti TaxID=1420851 RepID=A0A1V8M9K2_9GAMM|nr:TIGR00730 family Rossman fold protein [Methyloprofundus sedimenti]OQK18217.1 LOG family protein [Methyloprofundus sedimenti]